LGEIPREFKYTNGNKTFLCYDSYFDDEDDDDDDNEARQKRILIFATKSALRKLSASEVLYIDGTFETASSIFAQIVTIHGEYRNEVLSLSVRVVVRPNAGQLHAVARCSFP